MKRAQHLNNGRDTNFCNIFVVDMRMCPFSHVFQTGTQSLEAAGLFGMRPGANGGGAR